MLVISSVKINFPGRGSGFPTYQVAKSRLTRSIGPDDHPQFSMANSVAWNIHGLESVKGDGQIFNEQNEAG